MIEILSPTMIDLNINGQVKSVYVKPSDTLLHTLRSQLGLTGAKPGCENGDCGACTVIVDRYPIKSCLMLTVEAMGREIITVEGLKDAPIQKAFIEEFAFQCGFCTSGFLLVCHSLWMNHPDADEATMYEWLQSNICRCTGYSELEAAARSILKGKKYKVL